MPPRVRKPKTPAEDHSHPSRLSATLADGTVPFDPGYCLPPPPDCLDHAGRLAWTEVGGSLCDRHMMSPHFRPALELYCMLHDQLAECDREIKAWGMSWYTKTGATVVNPAVSIRLSVMRQMRQFLTDMGMTPTSTRGAMAATTENPSDRKGHRVPTRPKSFGPAPGAPKTPLKLA